MGGYALPSENILAYSKGDGLIIKGPIRMFEKKNVPETYHKHEKPYCPHF